MQQLVADSGSRAVFENRAEGNAGGARIKRQAFPVDSARAAVPAVPAAIEPVLRGGGLCRRVGGRDCGERSAGVMGTSFTALGGTDTEQPYGSLNISPSGSVSHPVWAAHRGAGSAGAVNQERAQESEVCTSLCCGDGTRWISDLSEVEEGEYISLFIDTRIYD